MSYTEAMSVHSNKQGQNKRLQSSVGIWFATLCWGGAYVAARFLLHPETPGSVSLSPTLLAALRFSVASLFFLFPLVQAIIRRQISLHQLLLIALLGLLAFSLYYWLQYIGIQQTNAGISSVLSLGLIPIFTALLAQLFGSERLHLSLFGVFLLGFVGVVLIAFQRPFAVAFHSGFFFGSLCLVVNTFLFALYTILSKRWMQDISPLVMTSGTMVSGTVGLVLLSIFDPAGNQWSRVVQLNAGQWGAVLYLAIGCSVLAYFAYNFALSQREASYVTVYFYIEPVISIVLGMILLGEGLTWQTVVGAAVIGVSVVFVHRMKSP